MKKKSIGPMKRKLMELDPMSLATIAAQISIPYTTQEEVAEKVASYYRDYGLKWDDLVARYEIVDGRISHP